jgi:hypothetical protein
VPQILRLEPTNNYGTMFASMFITTSPGFRETRLYSRTGTDRDAKIDNISTANFAIIFVGLSENHVLEKNKYPTSGNVTF